MIRVIIAGGREFSDHELLYRECDKLVPADSIILSGGARGADRIGETWARERGLVVERYLAEWDRFGKSAGYIRNREMAAAGDMLIAFHDGISKGTKHMIDLANAAGLQVHVIPYGQEG